MLEREFKALSRLMSVADGLASDHDDIFENLLGEVPMLRRRAACDVCGRKYCRNEDPGIVQDAFRTERIEGRGDVCSGPDPAQPTLLAPSRETLCSIDARKRERLRHIGDVNNIARRGQNLQKLGTAVRQAGWENFVHVLIFAISGNYCIHYIPVRGKNQCSKSCNSHK